MEPTLASLVNERLVRWRPGVVATAERAAVPRSGLGAIMSGLAALFLDEVDALDADAAFDRLDHVVDRETRHRHRRQRLHLDAGRPGDLDGGADGAAGHFL